MQMEHVVQFVTMLSYSVGFVSSRKLSLAMGALGAVVSLDCSLLSAEPERTTMSESINVGMSFSSSASLVSWSSDALGSDSGECL
mmetsp:Transcript_82212/g.237574  ORF Transcript_82212/g.237574 Transcript_82212/m.237574 type:complete len:85 (-) Transcript_82212:251-505(-)